MKTFLILKNIVLIELELLENKEQSRPICPRCSLYFSPNLQYLGKWTSLPREQYISRSTHYFLSINSLTSPPTLYLMILNDNGHLFLLVFKFLLIAPIFCQPRRLKYPGVVPEFSSIHLLTTYCSPVGEKASQQQTTIHGHILHLRSTHGT